MSARISNVNSIHRRALLLGGASGAAAASLAVRATDGRGSQLSVARGHVFEDTDATGVRSSRSPGLAGVMVSNGRDVVSTKSDGSWSLPAAPGDSIFVIKPPHWSTAIPLGAPHYLHQPDGTPAHFKSRFAGIDPTGQLPQSIDFPLRRSPEPSKFDVLLAADTQPGNEEELGFVRETLLAGASSTGAAFAIHHGDVMGDDLGLFERYKHMLLATGMPWHHCPGNHDMNTDSGDPNLAFETWKRTFGPTTYALQHGQATFILLNNVDPIFTPSRGYVGRIGDDQLAFVANIARLIPRDHLLVVSMHIPLINFEDPENPSDNTIDASRLLRILASHPRSVSFSGHSHTTEHHYLGADRGFDRSQPHHHHVLTAACGSWWSGPRDVSGIPISESRDGTPRGHHILSIDGSAYSTRFVSTSERPSGRLRCAVDRNQLLVNVFDGGPRTRVMIEFAAQGCPTLELQRAKVCDPHFIELLSQDRTRWKPWAAPGPSSHIWTMAIGDQLPEGSHRINIRTIGEYGAETLDDVQIEIRT